MKLTNSIMLLTFMLSGCVSSPKPPEIVPEVHEYSDIEQSRISWNDIFAQEQETYKVYFYSESCGYCRELKEDIISYYKKGIEVIYFVCTDEYAVFNTGDLIGINNINDFFILGTPMLVEITNSTVTNSYAGLSMIRNYIEEKMQK